VPKAQQEKRIETINHPIGKKKEKITTDTKLYQLVKMNKINTRNE
jgi:hypothetical protein